MIDEFCWEKLPCLIIKSITQKCHQSLEWTGICIAPNSSLSEKKTTKKQIDYNDTGHYFDNSK